MATLTKPKPIPYGLRPPDNRTVHLDTDAIDRHIDIERLLRHLPTRELHVITNRYGLNGQRPHTLDEIGQQLNVTRERVTQILHHALERLRTYAEFDRPPPPAQQTARRPSDTRWPTNHFRQFTKETYEAFQHGRYIARQELRRQQGLPEDPHDQPIPWVNG